jgi:iron complex outermembrane receptor protein
MKVIYTRISSKKGCCIAFLFFIILLTNTISGQTFSISGEIKDTLHNPLQFVNVILSETSLGDASDKAGRYEISNLSPGIYQVEFSALGYQSVIMDSIEIINKSIVIDVVLIEEAVESEQVVITAGKYEQNKSELPVSAEIIEGAEFLERNFLNLEDALRYVPGVNMTEDQISIRGSSGYSRGVGSRALLAIDGLPFYTGDTGETVWEMIPVTELQRVEIIKGAASSLYGSSAIGGVINGISRDISPAPTTYFDGFVGFYDKPYHDMWDWSGEHRLFNGLTLAHSNRSGQFGFNISFTRLEDFSYRQDDFFKKYIGFLKAIYNFTPSSSITLLANTFNKRAGNFVYWKDSHNALIPPDENQGERVETNRYLFGLIYKSVLSNEVFLNIKARYYLNDWTDNATPLNESTSHLYRGEVQLNTILSDNVVLITGIEGLTSNVNSNLFGNPSSYGLGIYALTDINFSFPMLLSIGLRYDLSKLDSLESSSAISPKLGLNYKISEKLILRSSVGTGFRAPTLAEAFTSTSASGITIKPNPNLESESNLTFEVAVNYDALSYLNLDFAVFNNEYFNMIEAGIDPTDGLVFFDNVIRARIQGAEVNTFISIIPDALTLRMSYTYLWARDLDKGTALRYRPRHIFYSRLEFRKWDLELGVDFRYWSEVEEIDDELIELGVVKDGELRVPVFATDFRAAYSFELFDLPFYVYFNLKNLANYNYIELIGNIRPIRNYSLGLKFII